MDFNGLKEAIMTMDCHEEERAIQKNIQRELPLTIRIDHEDVALYASNKTVGLGMIVQQAKGRSTMALWGDHGTTVHHFHYEEPVHEGIVHQHQNVEIGYVVNGKAYQRFGNQDVVFEEGDCWIVDRNCYHQDNYYSNELFTVFIDISGERFLSLLEAMPAEHKGFSLLANHLRYGGQERNFFHFKNEGEKEGLESVLLQIVQEIQGKQLGYESIVSGLLLRGLGELLDHYRCILNKQEVRGLSDLVFKDIRQYMKAHYQRVSIEALCRVFHYHPDFYNRIIKEYTQMTYSEYLQTIRMEQALIQLRETNNAVEDIVHHVGYSSVSSFYKRFKELYHTTPNRYREQIRKTDKGEDDD